jgi:GNAT superfamily N-acetyltransferase
MGTTVLFNCDRESIEALLRRDVDLHLYEIGDLDNFFWPRTAWHGLIEGGVLREVLLVYAAPDLPTVLALSRDPSAMRALLREIAPSLPDRFYAHLSPGLAGALDPWFRATPHGEHAKMSLSTTTAVEAVNTSEVILLSESDAPDLLALYEASYPGNWFDPRMLETGHYAGIRRHGELVSAAGVHVYSRRYRVAALGNITTRPDLRGKGLGAAVTAGLCKELARSVEHIGLNVKSDNASAIACYAKLGFERVAVYDEMSFDRRPETG